MRQGMSVRSEVDFFFKLLLFYGFVCEIGNAIGPNAMPPCPNTNYVKLCISPWWIWSGEDYECISYFLEATRKSVCWSTTLVYIVGRVRALGTRARPQPQPRRRHNLTHSQQLR